MTYHFNIRIKIVLMTFACIFFFAVTGGYYFIQRESKLYMDNIVRQGKTIAEISSIIFTNSLVYKELKLVESIDLTDYLDYYILDVMKREPKITYIIVLDKKGRVLSHSDIKEYGKRYEDPITSRAILKPLGFTQTMIMRNGVEILDISVPLKISTKSWGVCRLGFSLSGVKEQVKALRVRIGIMLFLFLIFAIGIISIVGKKLTRPLVRLSQTMDEVTKTLDLEVVRMKAPRRNDEIGKLEKSFSWMVKRLQEANKERLKMMDLSLRSEKMASIGLLAAGVAHEINNPLGGIILCFNNLISLKMAREEKQEHIDLIQAGLDKIQNAVRELLNFSKKSPMKMVFASINELLEESLTLSRYLMGRRHIKVVQKLDENIPLVKIDPAKMGQVFLNIIINAIHAMGDKGTLTITSKMNDPADRSDPGRGRNPNSRRNPTRCVIIFKDTGPGIDAHLNERIFDPFFTTKGKDEGTGLGLAISKTFIKRHHGTLKVNSIKGEGATFTITLSLTGHEINASKNITD